MEANINPKRGEIWLVDLNPTIGQEINKQRTCLVVNDDIVGTLKNKTVVPITEWKDAYKAVPWMVKLDMDASNKLYKNSSADCFQIRNVSKLRFVKKIGEINGVLVKNVHQTIMKTLDISYELK